MPGEAWRSKLLACCTLKCPACAQVSQVADTRGTDCAAAAAEALLTLSESFTNVPDLVIKGWQGWANGTSPCLGWTGISCNSTHRVTKMYAPTQLAAPDLL